MKMDEYGSALEEALRTSDHPVTASELREKVGCSRQRVYVWLQANEPHLQENGRDRAGGMRYTWVDNTPGSGDSFHMQSFFVDKGQVVFVLIGPDGSKYHARPAA